MSKNETARAKFYVDSVTHYGDNNGTSVELLPVFGLGDDSENAKFWSATPSGKITMFIKSDAAEVFIPRRIFYIDFIPVPSPDIEG